MNHQDALRILGLQNGIDQQQLKKRYRQLLHLVHPDAAAFREEKSEYPYSIHEIRMAYGILTGAVRENTSERPEKYSTDGQDDQWTGAQPERDRAYAEAVWDAEENPDAFCEREILQNMEDFDGSVLGFFSLVKGRYLWQPEEEFPLFLLSINRAVTELIAETEQETENYLQSFDLSGNAFRMYSESFALEQKREVLKKVLREQLTYLLAQQFVDAANTLAELVPTKKSADGKEVIYAVSAMLEPVLSDAAMSKTVMSDAAMKKSASAKSAIQRLSAQITGSAGIDDLKAGEILLPGRMDHHRLYLRNKHGQEVGYVSFPDDRMYYLVVPLFEQRRVQVKIKVAEEAAFSKGKRVAGANRRRTPNSRKLHLWLKFKDTFGSGAPEDLNGQIRQLLEEYKKELLTMAGMR